jgi:hypothetical protein
MPRYSRTWAGAGLLFGVKSGRLQTRQIFRRSRILPESRPRRNHRQNEIGNLKWLRDTSIFHEIPKERKMPLKRLSKLLYPDPADWQRRKQFKTMVLVVLATLFLGCFIAGLVLFLAYKKRF